MELETIVFCHQLSPGIPRYPEAKTLIQRDHRNNVVKIHSSRENMSQKIQVKIPYILGRGSSSLIVYLSLTLYTLVEYANLCYNEELLYPTHRNLSIERKL